jgi:hypothetical protein
MNFKIKNHVTKKAKRISGILQGKYGFGLDLLDKALQGDQNALKSIGEAARQGQQVQELMPLLTEAYIALIKGTEEYNKGVSTILKQGASSAIAIDKAASQALLANQKYGHQRSELAAEFTAAKTSEETRHQYAVNYIQLKAYIDQYLTKVDNDAKLVDQSYRPELKQVDEDKRYQMTAAKHLLQNGETARLDLMPKREYATVTEGNKVMTFREKLKGLASALGL